MYGVSEGIDLTKFVDAELCQIALGLYQVQFHFQRQSCAELSSILVEGRFETSSADGSVLEIWSERTADCAVFKSHALLGKVVTRTEVAAPTSISLHFNDGMVLRVFDNSDRHESFQIQPGNIIV